MRLFRRKVALVEAVQWTGDNDEEVETFSGTKPSEWVGMEPGDWVVRWGDQSFSPMTPENFSLMYEPLL